MRRIGRIADAACVLNTVAVVIADAAVVTHAAAVVTYAGSGEQRFLRASQQMWRW